MSRAAANEITVRGLDDIVSVGEVATVVWNQGGNLPDDKVMEGTLETVQVLLESGWAKIGDMVVSEWALENQRLALIDPEEAKERMFARSRELMSLEPGSRAKPIREWPLNTEEALARIRGEWSALGRRTLGIGDIGWLLSTPTGDQRGQLILDLRNRVIDFALKGGAGSLVRLDELVTYLHTIAPDFSAEELREGTISALDGLLRGRLAELGTIRRTPGLRRFVRWRWTRVEEALERVRMGCLGMPGGAEEGHICSVRIQGESAR